ncbi:MAG: transcriptional regulator, AraC family [Pseudonocardia sp.]|nr:transcriptional regulator, AraC family [Pseudonocardia sp.]
MDSVSYLIRMARLRGTVDKRCLLAGPAVLSHAMRTPREAPFHLLLQGACTLELAGRSVDMAAGDMVLLPRGPAHQIRTHGPGQRRRLTEQPGVAFPTASTTGGDPEVDLFCGHYDLGPGAGDVLFSTLPEVLHVSFDADSSEPVRMLSTLMRGEAQHDGPGTAAVVSALCDALLAMVLRSTPNRRLEGDVLWTAVQNASLRNVVEAVLHQPGRGWTIAELAELAAMSRATFIRQFTRATGMSAGDFLTRIRMITAAELLRTTDQSVGSVAVSVGYRSESAFVKAFRLATSSTPARFRRNNAREPAS